MTPAALYGAGLAGVAAAIAGEVTGTDLLAALGYLVAVLGFLGGFRLDRRRG